MNDARSQAQEAHKQQEATKTGLKQIKVAVDALTNEVKAYRAEAKGQDGHKWIKRTAKAAIGYTVLTAVIMLAGLYQTYLIRSNNVVSQRAFVGIFVQGGPMSTSGMGKITTQNVLNAVKENTTTISSLGFIAQLTNSGNTGTKNLTFFAKCAPSSEDLQEPWVILYQGQNNPIKTPQYIGPHASIQTVCGFPIEQIQAMSAGKLFGYVMVDVTYQDRLSDEWHRTETVLKIAQVQLIEGMGATGLGLNQAQAVLANVGKHNCADEECPPN